MEHEEELEGSAILMHDSEKEPNQSDDSDLEGLSEGRSAVEIENIRKVFKQLPTNWSTVIRFDLEDWENGGEAPFELRASLPFNRASLHASILRIMSRKRTQQLPEKLRRTFIKWYCENYRQNESDFNTPRTMMDSVNRIATAFENLQAAKMELKPAEQVALINQDNVRVRDNAVWDPSTDSEQIEHRWRERQTERASLSDSKGTELSKKTEDRKDTTMEVPSGYRL